MAILYSLLAAFCFGSIAVFASLGLARVKNTVGTLVSLVSSAAIVAALAITFELPEILALPAIAFGWFLVQGIVTYGMGRFFQFTGVSIVGASRASSVVAASPLFATVFAIVFIGERPSIMTLAGMFSIVGGIVLVVTERRSRAS